MRSFKFNKMWNMTSHEKNIPNRDVRKGMEEKEVRLVVPLYTTKQRAIDLKDMYDPSSPYSPEQKIQAAQAYLITGTSIKAQKYCGVKADIIRGWKTRSTWWPDLFNTVKKQKNDELDAQFTAIMDDTIHEVADRVLHGDEKVMKDGTLSRVKMGGKELAIVLSIMYDKRALLRGDITSRVETTGNKDAMKLLQDKFEDIAKQLEESNQKVIGSTYEIIEDKGNG